MNEQISRDPKVLLDLARKRLSQKDIASALNVNVRTVRRWENGDCVPPSYLSFALEQQMLPFPEPETEKFDFRFVDLFAGIGGTRLAFDQIRGQCVFTCEWNKFANKTYEANFEKHTGHIFAEDITEVDETEVPDHDVLVAGFPCQPFSIAGVSKKNALGKPHGFECTTQGTLFFDIARILKEKRPKAFLLENVKNLLSHDGGNTFKVILETLRNELGYHVTYKVIDSRYFLPQHRERLIIVGFDYENDFTWDAMELPSETFRLESVLHPEDGSQESEPPYTSGRLGTVNPKYTLTPNLWTYLQAYAEKHRAAGNGFGFGLFDSHGVARTLSARYYKDGSEILISQGKRRRPRRLTPRECARLMGFPDEFIIPVSDTQAYRQFGNSVAVPVIREVARMMKPYILARHSVAAHAR